MHSKKKVLEVIANKSFRGESNLPNNSRRNFSKAEIGVWHVTAVNLPQTYAETVDIASMVVWLAFKNLKCSFNQNFLHGNSFK